MDLNASNNISDMDTSSSMLSNNNSPMFVYLVLISAISIPGNLLIILTIQCKLHVKSSTDHYIVWMAVFDLLCGLLVSPMLMFQYNEMMWLAVRSSVFCGFRVSLTMMTTCASTLLLGAVAVDRFSLTCNLSERMSKTLNHRAKTSGIIIMFVSVVFATVNSFISGYDPITDKCAYKQNYRYVSIAVSTLLMLIFICVLGIIIVCYIRISLVLRAHHSKTAKRNMTKIRSLGLIRSSQVHPASGDLSDNGPAQTSTQEHRRSQETEDQQPSNYLNTSKHLRPPSNIYYVQSAVDDLSDNGSLQTSTLVHRKSQETDDQPTLPSNSLNSSTHLLQSSTHQLQLSTHLLQPESNIYSVPPSPQSQTPSNRSLQPSAFVRAAKLKKMAREQKAIHKTTLMLFLISAVYFMSWVITWCTSFIKVTGVITESMNTVRGLVTIAQTMFLINVPINPIFYFIMSTRFRDNVLILLRLRKKR